jgi:hypothetical protein
MPLCGLRVCTIIFAVAGAFLTSAASAQAPARKESTASASIAGIYQSDADLDGGGDVGWSGVILNGDYALQVTPQLAFGFTLRYDYERWTFSSPAAFGGTDPWSKLNFLNLGLTLDYAYQDDLRFGVSPVFGWSYETGAGTSNVMDYGAVLSVRKIFSPRLVLGGGVSVFRQIDETKVFPFLILHWQIDDRWRLANPFRAGPSGGAGLELAYAIDDNWEIAGGGAYRSYRFRLDDHGIAPGGVGENRFLPVFARVTRKFGPQTRLDFYAGASTNGRVSTMDTQGTDTKADYQSAPVLGLTLAHRF